MMNGNKGIATLFFFRYLTVSLSECNMCFVVFAAEKVCEFPKIYYPDHSCEDAEKY